MDLDLDYSELGGNISWVSPLESAQARETSFVGVHRSLEPMLSSRGLGQGDVFH